MSPTFSTSVLMGLSDVVSTGVRASLSEDLGSGDRSLKAIDEQKNASAEIICNEDAILCGIPWAEEVFRQIDSRIVLSWNAKEGSSMQHGLQVCRIEGPAQGILCGERSALNWLGFLSGIATVTWRYVQAVSHTNCRILDTRKTVPSLRVAQKYATKIGGAVNHRMGLFDAAMLKDNHLKILGGIKYLKESLNKLENTVVIVEVENLAELEVAIKSGAKHVLLDNFTLRDLHAAVHLAQGRVCLEASGNITLNTLSQYAETGVDFISVGALTKHVCNIDLSMNILEP